MSLSEWEKIQALLRGKKAGRTATNWCAAVRAGDLDGRSYSHSGGCGGEDATANGDAWLLDMTDCDCVQIASDGQCLSVPIDENSETIEINWSHIFVLDNKQLVITAYADKTSQVLATAPTRELNAAMRRMRKHFSVEQLQQVHVGAPKQDPSA
jgi:hypothetical protein